MSTRPSLSAVRTPGGPSPRAGRWLRVLSRQELARALGESVEAVLLSRLDLSPRAARQLRWAVARAFFARTTARARRVRGLSRREFLRELERTHGDLLASRNRARAELTGLERRLEQARSSLATGELGVAQEQELADELSREIAALLASPPMNARDAGAAIEALVQRERERRTAAFARSLEVQRMRIDVLERRVAKLRSALAQSEEDLAALLLRAEVDTGISSIYRQVQGLSTTGIFRAEKLELLRAIFEANLELQHRHRRSA